MKYLITGAAGFIGSSFAKKLLEGESSSNLYLLDKLTYASNSERINKSGFTNFFHGSTGDSNLISSLVEKVDVVVNFAAETHVDNSIRNPETFITNNVVELMPLLRACSQTGVRLHHISTDEVFGDIPLESSRKFKADDPYMPSSPYAASKASADLLVHAWSRTFGMDFTISICSNNYGPGQHQEKLIPHQIRRILSGQNPVLYGDGLNKRDWIHVEDHIDGILRVLEVGKMGHTYLFGGGRVLSNLEVVQKINSLFQRPKNAIDFVEDRPGHDAKYSIDFSATTAEIGWQPRERDFDKDLLEIISLERKTINNP